MKTIAVSCLLCAALAMAPAMAQSPPPTSLQVLVDQQIALRAELAKGIEGITPRQARIIDKAQGEFFAIVAGKQSLDELGIEDKIRVENALETISAQAATTRFAADDQQVCWRETKVGTKLPVTVCASKKELGDGTQEARNHFNRPRICAPPGCGAIP